MQGYDGDKLLRSGLATATEESPAQQGHSQETAGFFNQGFPLVFGVGTDWPVHYGKCSSSPGLCLLEVSDPPTPVVTTQTWPNDPWEPKLPAHENHSSRAQDRGRALWTPTFLPLP